MLYFHSVPSPTALIFGVRLLLQCRKSFPAFSYNAYFHPAPSSTALIFIPHILLLWRREWPFKFTKELSNIWAPFLSSKIKNIMQKV
jgi:hypothetical protein